MYKLRVAHMHARASAMLESNAFSVGAGPACTNDYVETDSLLSVQDEVVMQHRGVVRDSRE